MSHWERDKNLSLDPRVIGLLNSLYSHVFPIKQIERLAKIGEPHILDQHFHIDVILRLTNNMQLTVQEKIRRENYLHFNDFTLEYYSNALDNTIGEAFKLCTDLYTYAWINKTRTKFHRAYIFKVLPFKLALINGSIKGTLEQNEKHSSASFYAFPFDEFEKDWFIYKQLGGIK